MDKTQVFLRILLSSIFLALPAACDGSQGRTTAESIDLGQTVDGRVRTEQGDQWTFDAQEGDIVTIRLEGDSLRDPLLELFDPAGIRTARDDDSGLGLDALLSNLRLDQTGTYTIVVSGFGGRTGSYSLSLETGVETGIGQAGGGGSLEIGQTVEGEVTSPAGEQWEFSGEEGTVIFIDVIGRSLDDTVVELYSPTGELLAYDDDSGQGTNSRISGLVLPQNGAYGIVVRGFDNGTGTYSMSVLNEMAGIVDAGSLDYGNTVRGTTTTSLGDRWTFEGQEGEVIAVDLIGGSLSDTYLELYSPTGGLVYEDDDSGNDYNARIGLYVLEETGAYAVVARGYDGGLGSYSLTVERIATGGMLGGSNPEGSMDYGESVSNEVTNALGDNWTFNGMEGDVITIDMIGLSMDDTYLDLYGPDNSLLSSDDDGGAGYFARIDRFELPGDGIYTVVARGFGGIAGTYELYLALGESLVGDDSNAGNPVSEGEIEWGAIVEGTVESADGDLWTFSGTAGTPVRIELNGASLQDTYLELYDPDGVLVASDDDSGPGNSSLIEAYILESDGVYSIIVRGYGGQTGTYALSLEEG